VSFLVFVAVGEIVVRIYTRSHILYDMEMSRYAKALRVKSADPRIGHVHKPNGSAHLMGVEVRINSDGMRDREYPVERNEKYQVIFLGDSLTLGWGFRQEETFENLIEEEINKRVPAEIINCGLIFHFAAAENYWDYYASLYRSDAPGWEAWKESIVLSKQICEDRGIKLQVVLLPELHELQNYPFQKECAAVSDFLRANRIDHLDLTPFFEDEAEPTRLWVAPDDGHPNAVAHRLIAQYALEFIFPRGR